MTDVVNTLIRSRMMSGIRGKDTKPEMLVRRVLFKAGYRFRLHRKDLPGVPDVVLPKWKVALFVHGCFWHMHQDCSKAKIPSTRTEFWRRKLEANVERDLRAQVALAEAGWRVVVVWECLTRDFQALEAFPDMLSAWIRGTAIFGEFSLPDKSR
ncbi:very short patch repair endonuclease [Pseudomonas aeruginosa]|uniref:very short patch repair endonuclease n=1 Tax=Pseudomonas aeruginosa TaxID=287 RepID=UPI0009A6F4F4|nr:DNA mismatch endonuclease Vsr [Pseudomonas aeruginosa]